MRLPFLLLALAALAFAFGCSGGSAFADARDGKIYRAVKIGGQVWMAENLNYEAEGSECYDNNPENCAKYGRLYNGEAAMKACPQGWHLPGDAEWDELFRFADGSLGKDSSESPYRSKTAGKYLKAASGWEDNKGKSGNGEDKFGFAALPGGFGYSDGRFYTASYSGYWWSASKGSADYSYSRGMGYNLDNANWYGSVKIALISVRCLRD